ncbi:hypothetical protein RB195_020159 [Necator americanus]|uniref:RRM domain-containing protein n=3 Tax=Strongyloidea TaxID=27829 RepID=A0ABR1CJN8_NECAM
MIHKKCRVTDAPYLRSNGVYRFNVPDEKVPWAVEFPDYNPPDYTDPSTLSRKWADPEPTSGEFKWNSMDGKINRVSFVCDYSLDTSSRPINPMGRTGLRGRGVLGRWGPNHAADPLVTRLKNGKLQFVAIKRGDTGEWAIPGGMVDAGEQVSETLKREFSEETLGGKVRSELEQLWKKGRELYRGYVDDHRNTDNAWMETTCVNFHDASGLLDKVELQAGDDAVNVRWINVDSNEPLYASHTDFIALLKKIMSRRAPPPIDGLYSLKVDNISYNTTQADLRRMFDKYGEIGDIHIPRDKYTRQSKGFGFVRFYSRRDAEYAMDRTDGRWVEGREIRVAMARYERPIDERGAYTRRGRSRSRSPRRRSRSRSPRRSRSRSPRSRSRSGSPRRSRTRSGSPRNDRRSASPNGKDASPERDGSEHRSKSGTHSRSVSPRDRD